MAATNYTLGDSSSSSPNYLSTGNLNDTETPAVSSNAFGSGTGSGISNSAAMGAGAGVGAALGGLAASGQAGADYSAGMQALNNAAANYNGIGVPTVGSQQVSLQQYLNQGQLNPYLQNAGQQGNSQLNTVTTDPRLLAAQMGALSQMQQVAQNGMSDVDRAQMSQALQQANASTNANQQSILANEARRGVGGSGNELAQELAASQAGSNQANANSLQIAAQAMQNRLAAAQGSQQMASGIQQQQYGQMANAAKAQDVINQFNTQAANQAMAANTQAQNQAQIGNLANAQSIANSNANLENQQQMYNTGLVQTNFANQMAKAGGQASVANGVYQGNMAAGNAAAQQGQQTGSALGTLAMLALL